MNPMNCSPLVSAVIPTYNRAQPTIEAIQSVLAQTYSKVEIIVVDDGSTDGSGELVEQFVQNMNSREIFYLCQSNQGASAARNAGIEKARGTYIAFLDSDDRWLPEKLEWQVRALQQFDNECGACFTDARCVDNSGLDAGTFGVFGKRYQEMTGIDQTALRSLAKSFCGFWISTLLARTDLIRQIGGFNPAIAFAEDRDLYFRLALVTSLVYIDKLLVCCDRNSTPPGSMCRPWDRVDVRLQGQQRMYESWLGLGDALPADVRKTVRQQLRATHCDWANWHLENEHYDTARQEVSRAVCYGLTPTVTAKWVLTWIAPLIARKLCGRPAHYLPVIR